VRFGVTSTGETNNGTVFTTSGSLNATDQTNNLALANRLAGRGSSLPNFINDDIDDGEGILAPSLDNRLNVNLPVVNPAGSLGFSVLAADFLLDLELSALETEGRGEVVSTPRVVTANQAEAFIQQGVEIPFEQATSSGASNVQFREAVLELRATPLITPDDRVQLQLSVKQDTVGEIFPTAQGGQVPSIDTRELSTRVLIDNGETIVLGGIFQEETTYQNDKVPVLGDIPVFGNLFRRRSSSSNKDELLIFVTPTILEERLRLP
jgi:type IV pilus assembly protein PilQ